MPFSEAAKNYMLDQLGANKYLYASLHNGNPGATGANEISGGSYVRKAITWDAASGGVMNASNQPLFDVPAGASVQYVGFWDAESAGNFQGSDDVTQESFTNAGTYNLTSAAVDLNA